MTYATAQDMTSRFGAEEMGCFETAAVAAALADASTEMDGCLGVRYELPLDATTAASALLKRLCCDIARSFCYDDTAPDRVVENAEHARKTLKALGQGTMVLPGSTGEADAEVSDPQLAERTGPEPVMTAEALEGF